MISEQKKTRNEVVAVIITGVVVTILAALLYKKDILSVLPMGTTMIALMVPFILSKKRKIDMKDERVQKMTMLSFYWSWIVLLLALSGIYWTDYFHLINWTIGNAIFAIYLIMVSSLWISRFILMRKGDVN
jgi:hypothetical protein